MPKAVLQRMKTLKGKLDRGNVTALSPLCGKVMKDNRFQPALKRVNAVKIDDDGIWHWNGFPVTKRSATKVYETYAAIREEVKRKKNRHTSKKRTGISSTATGKAPLPESRPTEQSEGAEMFVQFLKETRADVSDMKDDIRRIKIALFDLTMDKRLQEANSAE